MSDEYSPECLKKWLFAKYERHGELEDLESAQLIDRLTSQPDKQESGIHRGRYHHPDCNYWKWDWRYSWDSTDCNCEDVVGPVEPTIGGGPVTS